MFYVLCFMFYVLCFLFYVFYFMFFILCFMFYVLCFMFYVLCYALCFMFYVLCSFNDSILNGTFPNPMKLAEITPSHKKNDKTSKENYRPISILSSLSKIFERIMHDDIYQYMESKLSPYLCGFRKGYSTQYCLVVMLERFKKALDNKNKFGALLTDLSKAFDCLNHDLLVAKLDACGFGYVLYRSYILYGYMILSYLSGRKHRTKVNNHFSEWADTIRDPTRFHIRTTLIQYLYKRPFLLYTRR